MWLAQSVDVSPYTYWGDRDRTAPELPVDYVQCSIRGRWEKFHSSSSRGRNARMTWQHKYSAFPASSLVLHLLEMKQCSGGWRYKMLMQRWKSQRQHWQIAPPWPIQTAICFSCSMLLTMNLEIHATWRKPENQGFCLQSQGKGIKQPGLHRSHLCWSSSILLKSQTKLPLLEFSGNFQSTMEVCWKAFRQLRS